MQTSKLNHFSAGTTSLRRYKESECNKQTRVTNKHTAHLNVVLSETCSSLTFKTCVGLNDSVLGIL